MGVYMGSLLLPYYISYFVFCLVVVSNQQCLYTYKDKRETIWCNKLISHLKKNHLYSAHFRLYFIKETRHNMVAAIIKFRYVVITFRWSVYALVNSKTIVALTKYYQINAKTHLFLFKRRIETQGGNF